MTDQTPLQKTDLASLERPARRAEMRIRLGRALATGTTALCIGLVAAAVDVALRKTGVIGERPARIVLGLLAAAPFVAGAVAYFREVPARAGAVALDRFHGLSDRLSSALTFAALPSAERTAFMDAAIDDAIAHAERLDPRHAVPLKAPRDLGAAMGLALAVVLIGVFEVRRHEPASHAQTIEAVDVTADDIDAMREFLEEMKRRDQSEEAKAATQEVHQP